MNEAVENLFSVSFTTVAFFLLALFLIFFLRRFHHSPELRTIKRKPLIIPAIVFLIIVPIAPHQHIGPPLGMESNTYSRYLHYQLTTMFTVYEQEPYLPRVRAEYSYPLHSDEIIECTVLVYLDDFLLENITSSITYSGSPEQLSTTHTTFDLSPGNYSLVFSQRVLQADGSPTPYIRAVDLIFFQLQDYTWIEVSFQWDQYLLVLYIIGIALFLIGLYVTDHNFDTPEEKERYQRHKNGERNYPYSRSYRRKMKHRK